MNTKRTKLVNGYETRAEGFMHLMDLAVAYGTRHDVDFVQYLQEMDARKAMSNNTKSKAKDENTWECEFAVIEPYMTASITVKELVKAIGSVDYNSSKVSAVLRHFEGVKVKANRDCKPLQYTLID